MAAAKEHKILGWQGILKDISRLQKYVVLAMLAVATVALTFAQQGFTGIGITGEYVAYAVVLLLPISLCALMFGMLYSGFLGFFAGIVLIVHANYFPLDYYELTFVTPVSSIGLLTAAGILLGLGFAIALRNNPPRVRRMIYIIIVCVAVSFFYSVSFVINVASELLGQVFVENAEYLGQVIENNAEDIDTNSILSLFVPRLATLVARMGSPDIQMWFDALMMAVSCIITDLAASRIIAGESSRRLSTTFNGWQFTVVFLAFMITSATSFLIITQNEKYEAEKNIESEVTYLCNQLISNDRRAEALDRIFESYGIKQGVIHEDTRDDYIRVVTLNDLLDGYTKDLDGIVAITTRDEHIILMSDDKRLAVGEPLSDHINRDTQEALSTSIKSGQVQRIVYDDYDISIDGIEISSDEPIKTQLAYMLAREVDNYMVMQIMPSSMVYESRAGIMMWFTLSVMVLLLVIYFITSQLLGNFVVRGINQANDVLSEITQGNLDAKVQIENSVEFKSLSSGINTTVDSLKGYISQAEKRMDEELSTAKAIQQAAIPQAFPPFPEIPRFDIFASMHAAKEVGGDFYDFFLVNTEDGKNLGRLAFVIADVSGKGVPAALFMMTAKTLIHNFVATKLEMGEALENINRQLCEGNDASMFVTAFVGVLDYNSGHLTYVNAGHNPPLLWKCGKWQWLRDISGMPLGSFDGMMYKAFELDLNIGDQLYLYTDGVTEAMDINGNQYSEKRLENLLAHKANLTSRQIVELVQDDVKEFTEGAQQSDDITMLSIEYGVPPELTTAITVPASIDMLDEVNEFVHAELDRRFCPVRAQNQLDIALEELFVNVANYAYPDATPENPGMVRVCYTYCPEPPSITIDIIDKGIPFDPLARKEVVLPTTIDEAKIGGMGIYMARQSVDELSYQYKDGCNMVTIKKSW